MSARSGNGAGFLRARRPEQKQQRTDAILAAARKLGIRDGVGLVSLAAIAAEVGVHKSALLKYFGTREEIFLQLSEAEWLAWADDTVAELAAVTGEDGLAGTGLAEDGLAGTGLGGPGLAGTGLAGTGLAGTGLARTGLAGTGLAEDRLAEVLGRSIADRPLFCQLLTHATLTLERNVSLDALRRSKAAAIRSTDVVVDAVHRLLPDLGRESCFELVAATALIAAGLWQAAHPPPVVSALYAELSAESAFSRLATIDLTAELSRFVRVYLTGLRSESARPVLASDPAAVPAEGPRPE